jgi:signal transduction histidine kinase
MAAAKILIVEDESIIALDIQNSLTNSGYDVVAIADCAIAALDYAAQLRPDLVLMDIRIRGDRDGVQTAEAIRSEFALPVVYLTAHADENTLQRAKISGPFGYILKPFEDRELITTIEIALSRHQAEAAIRESLFKEQELHELKSRFVAVVSHEFRNPLNAILFSTELLQRYGEQLSGEKKETYLHRIQLSVKRMNQLLDDVLTISEQEAGTLKCQPQPLDLVQFCPDLIEELYPSEKTPSRIIFTYQHHYPSELGQRRSVLGAETQALDPPDLENITALPMLDGKLLRHILTNLLSNAIKYSPKGQSIYFDVTRAPEVVVLKIRDQGIGIPDVDQVQLFSSFHRASNVSSIPGTGLGLSIVKQCVDLHRGKIFVMSQVNQGTTFIVTLPLQIEC